MSKLTEALLDVVVKKSLGFNPMENQKWSIVPCAKNEFLADGYDPFEDLAHTLMIKALMNKYNIEHGRI